MTAINDGRAPVPRDPKDDYTRRAADTRQAFLSDRTGATFEHVSKYSFDPAELAGNIEQFVGVVQVPMGVADRCSSTANTRRASSTSRWRRPRGRSSPATTAG